ncbi:MAG: hypothetical protein NT119_05620 [Actinobacteria bacterium]|nr:hypothetical protein [Actinomycetota bacterium]
MTYKNQGDNKNGEKTWQADDRASHNLRNMEVTLDNLLKAVK